MLKLKDLFEIKDEDYIRYFIDKKVSVIFDPNGYIKDKIKKEIEDEKKKNEARMHINKKITKKEKIKAFFNNIWIITIVGGVIVVLIGAFITSLFN